MDLTLDVPSTLRCPPVQKTLPACVNRAGHVKSSTSGKPTVILMLGCGMLVTARSRRNSRKATRHAVSNFNYFSGMEHGDGCSANRADLFLQLPLRNGVLLSGVLSRDPPKVNMLPPAADMPELAIVPRDGAACVPFTEVENPKNSEVLRRFHPGPLQPDSASGKALQKLLRRAPEEFEVLSRYEHLRASISSNSPPEEQAEVLLLDVYMRFQRETGAPPRPGAESEEAYDLYIHTCKDVAMKALHQACSPDFCMIAEAHVLGLAKTSGFPRQVPGVKHLFPFVIALAGGSGRKMREQSMPVPCALAMQCGRQRFGIRQMMLWAPSFPCLWNLRCVERNWKASGCAQQFQVEYKARNLARSQCWNRQTVQLLRTEA
eukprot:symbB.v1.2.014420.t1/scaffold1000.1/size145704/11